MAASAFTPMATFLDQLGKEGHNLSSDTLKVALYTSSPSAYTAYVDTNEVSSTNTGYTTGGATLGSVSWTGAVLNAANTQWTAGSAGLTAKYALVYNSTTGGSNNVIAWCDLNEGGGSVTVTTGNNLTID